MRAKLLVLAALVVLIAAVGASAETAASTTRVVLVGGSTIDVASASIQGGYVYLTYPDGRMQAYPSTDVDLVASGLVPTEANADESEPARPVRPEGLAAAQSRASGAARMEITDDDVQHVRRVSIGEDEGGESDEGDAGDTGATASLLVSNLEQQVSSGNVTLTGTVSNNGAKPVSTITLEARATDRGGATVGTGSTVIPQQLEPKGSVGFTLSFPVEGEASAIRVRASAAVADFDFQEVAPAANESGEAEGSGEGGT